MVSAPLAAGLSSLVPEERELGATIIDMGGGTTSMAVYAENQMMHTAQLPIGGLHVTRDLAIGLSTTLVHAERLKTLYGNVESSPDDDRELLPVPLVGEEDHQLAKVPRSMVVSIIRPRIEETFEYIKDRLDGSGLGRIAGNRVVLTGGACQLPGVREMAARMLNRQVRQGRPAAIRGLPELASGPAFSTAAGLLSWAAGEGRIFFDAEMEGEPPVGLFRRLVNFLKERV
jgi:cell division protein FtsA